MKSRLLHSASALPAQGPASGQASGLGGCARCCVSHYCAVYEPLRLGAPADCPFGPGLGASAHARK